MDRFLLKYSEEEVGNAGKSCVGLYRFLKAIWLLSTPAPAKPAGISEEIQRVRRTIEVYKDWRRNSTNLERSSEELGVVSIKCMQRTI